MKVLLLGGTGVFGSRLARLLVRDGHSVTLAGRTLDTAQDLAQTLGCKAMRLDRNGDLSGLSGHDVLVDAAGPFHAYGNDGEDPYRLARKALAAGMHYLDLADNAGFCAGITALDDDARAAGLCAISGLSSVPALSSAAVRALTGQEVPDVIETAILPGNRSPRGLSVMASILSQAGQPMRLWRGGMWTEARSWSEPSDYSLPEGLTRQGWLIEVPDITLFPAHFGAGSVVFRAGLELSVMSYGLRAFAKLRQWRPIPVTPFVLKSFKLAADMLEPFGSGRGGMSVMVAVGSERRFWRLLAEEGDGPFIPAIPARALLRRETLPVGARPALEVITLEEAEAAMEDLRVKTVRSVEPFQPIFPGVLGAAFHDLPEAIRETHRTIDQSRWRGTATITRGSSLWSRMLCLAFRFPPAGENMPVEVVKTVTPRGETWERRFGQSRFVSHLAPTAQGMTERFGPFTFLLGLTVDQGTLKYPIRSARFGPVALPRRLLPQSEAYEYAQDGRFHFDVRLLAPITGQVMVHYQGNLGPAVSDGQKR